MNALLESRSGVLTGSRARKIQLSVKSVKVQDVAYWFSIALIFVFATRDFIGALVPSAPMGYLMYALSATVVFLGILSLGSVNIYVIACIILVEMVALSSYAGATSFAQREYISLIFFDVSSMLNVCVFLLAFARVEKPDQLNKHLIVLSVVCLTVIVAATLSGNYSSDGRGLNYLGVGIGSVVWISYLIQASFSTRGPKQIAFICLSVFSGLFVAIYGNRGALVAIFMFIIYSVVRYTDMRHKIGIALVLLLGVALFSVLSSEIYSAVTSLVNEFGIYSRNLTLSLSNSLLYSTHRDVIWLDCIKSLEDHWFSGYGFAYDRVIGGAYDVYAHNIVLELCLIFGILPGLGLFFAHMAVGFWMCFKCDSDGWSRVYAPFFITSTAVLMFNSSLLTLSIFWGSYGLLFAYLRTTKLRQRQARSERQSG